MLAIRFNRTGKRNQAHFRVVLQEHTKAPGKRHIEILGSYDPHKKVTILKKERILYWIGQGAQVSPVVSNLLVREGVIDTKKIAKKMPRPVVKEPVVTEAPVSEAPVAEVASVEVPVETVPEVTPVKEEAPVEEKVVPAETKA
jgi:small subunit ribosomal protein S16